MAKSDTVPLILIVDDDEGLCILMADAFSNQGCEVARVDSGAAALTWLKTRTPDLMLLDLKMKGLGGAVLIERLKQENSLVPFVVVTGQGDEYVAVEMMKQGALDYVMKDTGLLERLPVVVKRALDVLGRNRALAEAEADRRRLQKEIIEISDREQQRIGHDLHDGLGQQLTAIDMLCAGLKSDVGSQPKLEQKVELIGKSIREAIAFVRRLSCGLAPKNDDPRALQVSLTALAELSNSLGRMRCRFECSEPVVIMDSAKALALYRIAQEAVNNALKHSCASEIVVRLTQTADAVKLCISDNGDGFSKQNSGGMGQQVMKHRAGSIGAELKVDSKVGRGVTITCILPRAP